jgi:hypothetical protein
MKRNIAKIMVVFAVALMAVGASASSIGIDLNQVIGGGFVSGDLSNSNPYLHAAITDTISGGNAGVSLTLTAPGLGFAGSGNYEHVLGWQFRVSTISGLTFTKTASSGHAGFTLPVISTGTFTNDPTTDSFNLQFLFSENTGPATDGPDGGVEFGNGDSVTYFIKGLSTSSFLAASPGTHFSAAQIDDAKAGTWVADSSGPVGAPGVPLPATVWGGLVLLGGGMAGRRARVSQRA